MRFLLLLVAIALLTACSQPGYLYYGDTSYRYYQSVKNPDLVRHENYKKSLERVFVRSEQQGLRVPPGLYCDYALLLLNEGDASAARLYLLKEKATWAASTPFIDFLLAKYGMRN